jgi:hypothetical protein
MVGMVASGATRAGIDRGGGHWHDGNDHAAAVDSHDGNGESGY